MTTVLLLSLAMSIPDPMDLDAALKNQLEKQQAALAKQKPASPNKAYSWRISNDERDASLLRVLSGWKLAPSQAAELKQIVVQLAGNPADHPDDIVIQNDSPENAEAKELLRFFWEPDAKQHPGENASDEVWWSEWPRLEVTRFPLKSEKSFFEPPDDQYGRLRFHRTRAHQYHLGIKSFLACHQKWGKVRGNPTQTPNSTATDPTAGNLVWLFEPGSPEQVLAVWTMNDAYEVVGPHVTPVEPLIVEPLPEFGWAKGVRRLPAGSLKLIREAQAQGLTLLAIGQEGLAFENKSKSEFIVYRLHHANKGYGQPIKTPGLTMLPAPEWVKLVGINRDQSRNARRLVAWSVCSPDVWKAEYPVDPELFALPTWPVSTPAK